MESKLMKSELLYIEEHLSCQNYMTTIETGFKYLSSPIMLYKLYHLYLLHR